MIPKRLRARCASAPALVTALVILAALLVAATAFARPGGGGSYSGGSHSSGGGGGGGGSGGGGDGSGLIQVLIWLIIEHPAVGIPVTLLIIVFFVLKARFASPNADWSTSTYDPNRVARKLAESEARARMAQVRTRTAPTLEAIRVVDPQFSRVIFEDFLYSLYTEVQIARGTLVPTSPGAPPASLLDRLSAYLAPAAGASIMAATRGPVSNVIVGALRFLRVDASPQGCQVEVEIESNYTEGGRGYYVVERWLLRRGPGAKSRTPDRVRVLGCPGCGAPQDALFGGKCRHCGRTVNDGSFDWVVQGVQMIEREARAPMLTANVEERGTGDPTIYDRGLNQGLAHLAAKDPSFHPEQLKQRVGLIFQQFQTSWSNRDLSGMRPFMSDALFSTQTYYVEAYIAQHLRNVTERARITGLEVVKVASDAFYDAVTVRLFAQGLDYTLRDDGSLACGNKSNERAYSEYWTVIRGTQRKGPARTDLACANCGAPLKVSMAGVCTYCKVKVTTGDFDWVLSRIEQDDSYTG